MGKRSYRHRTVCGHCMYVSENGSGGAEWCDVCRCYVAVMVSVYEHAVREYLSSSSETAA